MRLHCHQMFFGTIFKNLIQYEVVWIIQFLIFLDEIRSVLVGICASCSDRLDIAIVIKFDIDKIE